jgi:DNA adenine methylase
MVLASLQISNLKEEKNHKMPQDNNTIVAKPFVKWAGGKGQLLSQLDALLPTDLSEREFTYIEPFVGGGAMLFHMLQKFPKIRKVVINDINPYLVIAYRTVKDNAEELIKQLSTLECQYLALKDNEAKKSFFLEARELFNEKRMNDIDRTKYLIFLNRTCFNGLYRVNAKGKFNVPFGQFVHPTICNPIIIKADSDALNSKPLVILNGDFEQTRNYIEEGYNFFYFDPPYRPLNATSSFNSYAKENFNDEEQIRLRDYCSRLNERLGIKWMLSNADCSAKNPEDTFFEDIYRDFYISRVNASRAINANPAKRGKLTELLISNYLPERYGVYAAEEITP